MIEDISQLVELQKILPICARCRKVRNDDEYWMEVEAYVERNMDVAFSHGYCPDCYKEQVRACRGA